MTAATDPPRRHPAAVLLGLVALAAGLALAWTHPLAPHGLVVAFVAVALATARWPCAWPAALPALLPLVALAPWSGALAVEEIDLAVLAIVAGACFARWRPLDAAARWRAVVPALGVLAIAALALPWTTGVVRGLREAGAWPGGWLDGYHEAGNVLRVAKSGLAAALLLPAWLACVRRAPERASAALAAGMAAGVAVVALVVLAERVAFTGLTNFSTDYRVTGPFWEMHTGGAALDGFLALALPWAALCVLGARTPLRFAACAAVAFAGYATALVTFSRAVWIALPVGLAVLALVRAREAGRPGRDVARDALVLAVYAALVAAGAWLAFRHGGYRALAAALGTLGLALAAAPALRALGRTSAAAWLGVGAAGALPLAVAAPGVPKGPYVLYALLFAAGTLAMLSSRHGPGPARLRPVAAAVGALAVAGVFVAAHWGGPQAFADASAVAAVLAAVAVAAAPQAGAQALRRRGLLALVAACVAGVVAVLSGGDYMSGRLAGARGDLDARLAHWSDTLRMLDGPEDWALGRGHGRFPADYLFHVPDGPHPGHHVVAEAGGRRVLRLAGPRHSASFGEMLRVGQWVDGGPGPYRATLVVRAARAATLHVEVCDRHLLYNGECALAKVDVKPGSGWQHAEVALDGAKLPARRWGRTPQAFFALAVESERGRVEVAEVALRGPDGQPRSANGTFDAGAARWFPLSERHHLPWHAKNLAVNVLYEQGALGLALFALAVAGALWRTVAGSARRHPLAPALAASLAGFLVVGLFDSLLDAPRVALLWWLVVFVALTLPARAPGPPGGGASTTPA